MVSLDEFQWMDKIRRASMDAWMAVNYFWCQSNRSPVTNIRRCHMM